MTHSQMECELARATGESRAIIRQRGFQLVEPPQPGPKMVDWDALHAQRVAIVPQRSGGVRRAAGESI